MIWNLQNESLNRHYVGLDIYIDWTICSVRWITIRYWVLCNGSAVKKTSVNCNSPIISAVPADGNNITTRYNAKLRWLILDIQKCKICISEIWKANGLKGLLSRFGKHNIVCANFGEMLFHFKTKNLKFSVVLNLSPHRCWVFRRSV